MGVENENDDGQNIFRLYSSRFDQPIHSREHSEALKKLKAAYPWDWIVAAFMMASRKSKDWTYAEGILKNWRLKGRGQEPGAPDEGYDGLRYVNGEFAAFIDH